MVPTLRAMTEESMVIAAIHVSTAMNTTNIPARTSCENQSSIACLPSHNVVKRRQKEHCSVRGLIMAPSRLIVYPPLAGNETVLSRGKRGV